MSGGVVIMAGGTGGHVFPALAVAELLRQRGLAVSWLGTRRGIEAELVPAAGIEIDWIAVTGLRGNGALGWITAPVRLLVALLQALQVLRSRRPAAVLGLGGFVAGPGGLAAWLLSIPLLIHEQNAVAGLTNRLLAPLATRVMEAFPGSFPAARCALTTGNPVRPGIAALPLPGARFATRSGTVRLLVLGGSQGARALNSVLPGAVQQLAFPVEILHQAGRRDLEATRNAYLDAGVPAWVEPFIEDMAAAYDWADLVICRAGALTIAELSAAGLGAVLVPYPHAVDDHQAANARYLATRGAAELLLEEELDGARLAAVIDRVGRDRGRLLAMAEAARQAAWPMAAERVAAQVRQVVARQPAVGAAS